nr:hypothetical protein [Tanacetum cinerariifolium]
EDDAVKVAKKKVLDNDIEDETLEVDEVVNTMESKNHPLGNIIGNLKQKDKRTFQRSRDDKNDKIDKKAKDEMCLTAQASDEICLGIDSETDEWIKDSGCSKYMKRNQKLFSTYKAYNGGNVVFGSNRHDNIIDKGQICDHKCKKIFSEHDSEVTKDEKVI